MPIAHAISCSFSSFLCVILTEVAVFTQDPIPKGPQAGADVPESGVRTIIAYTNVTFNIDV